MFFRAFIFSLAIAYFIYNMFYPLIYNFALIPSLIGFVITLFVCLLVVSPTVIAAKSKNKNKIISIEGIGFIGFLIGFVCSCFFLRGAGENIWGILETSFTWGFIVGGAFYICSYVLTPDDNE